MEGEVTISKDRYFRLRKSEIKLMLLEAGGVDSWEWYEDSLFSEFGEGYDELCEQEEQRIKNLT